MSETQGKVYGISMEEFNLIPKNNRPKKLAILGFAPSWNKTDFNDPDLEVWIINGLYRFIDQVQGGHFEYLFEMHERGEIYRQDDDGHVKRLAEEAKKGKKIVTCEYLPEVPECIVYPLDDIIGLVKKKYFTNTISYLIAYACYLKKIGEWDNLEQIEINGVDMAQDSEYSHQRPSCELFIGFAQGMGIDVKIPSESDLCKSTFLYGYDINPLPTEIFQSKINVHKKQIEELQANRVKITNWRNGEIQKIENKFNHDINQIDAYINQIRGALDMSEYYKRVTFSQLGGVPFNPTFTKDDINFMAEKKKEEGSVVV